MRKLVLIFGVFTLVMTQAFAQIALNGNVDTTVTVAEGDTQTDDNAKANITVLASLSLSAVAIHETIGGKVTFDITSFWAYVWWKPLDQLMFKIGYINKDSTWAGADITDWGLHANDFNVKPAFSGGGGYAGNILPAGYGFYYAADDLRAQLSVYPIEGLAVNFGFPMTGILENNYLDNLNAQVVYELAGIGEAAVSFVNAPEGSSKNIFAQWTMPLPGYMKIEFGFNYGLAAKGEWKEPLKFGLGWGLGSGSDTMILTARLGVSIPMEGKPNSLPYTNANIPTFDPLVGLDFVLNYDLDMFRLYVPVGLGLRLADDTYFAWNFNPYIAKELYGLNFYAGFMLYNGALYGSNIIGQTLTVSGSQVNTKDRINWAIPIGLRWEF